MAINSYELLLTQKVVSGEISFTMDDMKNKTAAQRKCLYKLGAYKNTMMSDKNVQIFGVKRLKKAIDLNISMTLRKLWSMSFGDALDNYERIVSPVGDIRGYEAKVLKMWTNLPRGRDLFVKGLGSFNIDEAIETYRMSYKNRTVLNPNDLIVTGYLGQPDYSLTTWLNKGRKELFSWMVRSKFPVSRIDELSDLDILDMWHNRLTLAQCIRRLDDMMNRNLKLDYMDKPHFDYPKELIAFCEQTDFCCPENGIALKKLARKFSNCSGSYVKSIRQKELFIIYSEDEMISLNGKTLKVEQHYGKRNEDISKGKKTTFKESISYFIRKGKLPKITEESDYKVMYDTVPNGHFKNTVATSADAFKKLKHIAEHGSMYADTPICSSGFNKFVLKSATLIELGYNHRKLVS